MKLTRTATALAGASLFIGAMALAQAAGTETIVTVVKVTGSNWFNRMDEGVKEFAKENPGINAYQTGPGQADAAQQLKIVEDLISKKVSALAVVPFDPPTLEPALKKAMDRGIKVVTHEADNEKNTDVDIEAFDNTAYGASLNEHLAGCMHQQGNGLYWSARSAAVRKSNGPTAGSTTPKNIRKWSSWNPSLRPTTTASAPTKWPRKYCASIPI